VARSPCLTPLTSIWQSAWVPTLMSGRFLHSTPVTASPASCALFKTLAASSLPLVAGLKATTSGDGVAVTVTVAAGAAVVDLGGVGVGDPGADVITAWNVFSHTGRGTF
jgi:hypothetical protein